MENRALNNSQEPALLFGGGLQIATSHYHSYNHGLMFTAPVVYTGVGGDWQAGDRPGCIQTKSTYNQKESR
jgi:hypothetical protein